MKPQRLLPKLSTALFAVSLFILVACNESTATAEQAAKENAQEEVKNTESVAAKAKENTQEVVQKTEPVATKAKESIEQAATPAAVSTPAEVKEKPQETALAMPAVSDAEKTTAKDIVLAETSRSNQTNNNAPKKPKAPVFVEGKHYFEIFPHINTDAPAGKVEVVELMWLGCPHCYKLEKYVKKYNKNKADYVAFKQVPAMLNRVWSKDAEMFYIAQLLDPKGEKKLINRIFHAIHEQGRRLKNEDSVKRYFSQLGVSEEQYNSTKNSMAYKAILHRARQISEASQISSVPSFIINGRYRTSPSSAGGEEKLFQLIDMLTEKLKK